MNTREATDLEREVIVQLECLRVRKALRLVFDVRGDQKTTVGASSEEMSSENDVEITVEIEKGT